MRKMCKLLVITVVVTTVFATGFAACDMSISSDIGPAGTLDDMGVDISTANSKAWFFSTYAKACNFIAARYPNLDPDPDEMVYNLEAKEGLSYQNYAALRDFPGDALVVEYDGAVILYYWDFSASGTAIAWYL